MLYKKNIRDVYARLGGLYGRAGLDRIYASIQVENPSMREALRNLEDTSCPYPDLSERIALWDRVLQEKTDLHDDSVPICYCSELDQGLASGLFGAPDIRFSFNAKTGWISSMSTPFMESVEMPLALDRTGLWADRMREQYRIFAEGARGKFAVAPICSLEGLNFLAEMRGATNAYLDIVDEPEILESIFDLSADMVRFVNDAFFRIVGLQDGGTAGYAWQWAPGRHVMDSVDAYHMTSEETFERWGRRCFEKIASHYDGSHVHIHANAYRMIPYVATLKGLASIHLGDDPYNPPAMDRINEFDAQRGTVPLIVPVGIDEFVRRLESRDLPGNALYLVGGESRVSEANELMRLVRAYRI